jgi:hypothetical protein
MKLSPVVKKEAGACKTIFQPLSASMPRSPSCCGVYELHGLVSRSPSEQAKMVLDATKTNRMIMYYSTNILLTTKLLSWGFVQWAKFKNPNTGHIVTCLVFLPDSQEV